MSMQDKSPTLQGKLSAHISRQFSKTYLTSNRLDDLSLTNLLCLVGVWSLVQFSRCCRSMRVTTERLARTVFRLIKEQSNGTILLLLRCFLPSNEREAIVWGQQLGKSFLRHAESSALPLLLRLNAIFIPDEGQIHPSPADTMKIILALFAHLPPFLRVEALELRVTLHHSDWNQLLMDPALQYLQSLTLEVDDYDMMAFSSWIHSVPVCVQSVTLSHVMRFLDDAHEVDTNMLEHLARRLPHITALDMAFHDIKRCTTALMDHFSHLRQLSLSSGPTPSDFTTEGRISVELIAQLNRAAPALEALEWIELRGRFEVGPLPNKNRPTVPFDCSTALQLTVSKRLCCASLVISQDINGRMEQAPLFAAHLPAPLIVVSVAQREWTDYGVVPDPLTIEERAEWNIELLPFTFPAIHQVLAQRSDKKIAVLCETYPDRFRYRGGARSNIPAVTARMAEEQLDHFFVGQPNSNALRTRVTVLAATPPELAFTGTYFYRQPSPPMVTPATEDQ